MTRRSRRRKGRRSARGRILRGDTFDASVAAQSGRDEPESQVQHDEHQQNHEFRTNPPGAGLAAARIDPGTVNMPVQLIWGERDRVLTTQDAIDALTSFPDAALAIVPDVGHVPQVENATRTAQLIARFAKSIA